MARSVLLRALLLVLISGLLIPLPASTVPPVHADVRSLTPDDDGDGLPNAVEQEGWYNAANASGPAFVTDSMDPDSDDDGLTDGQEKLYDTHPLDDHSPGIYVEHEAHYQTKEYYPWQRFGGKYIVLPAPLAPEGEQTVVVRRGTTFSVGGPPDAELRITKSISSLSTLNAVRDPCSGRWDIYVPAYGTVGIYTITMEDGDWSESLNLYVIFQLPSGVSEAFTNTFVYDDNPYGSQDETAVHYSEQATDRREYTNEHYSWIPEGRWINHGYAWGFAAQQYEAFILEDHVMPAINGQNNTWNAANRLGSRVDQNTCVEWPQYYNNAYCVLNPRRCSGNYRNECTTVSALLTSFLRSAGIPARPVWADWEHSSFDHSTEVWTKPSGGNWNWFVMRGYAQFEGPCTSPTKSMGYKSLSWPRGWYGGQGVYAVGENWSLSDVKNWWGSWQDEFRQSSWDRRVIVRKDWFKTRFRTYWGWSSEPTVVGTPPADWPPCCPASASDLSQSDVGGQAALAEIGQVVADYGLDLDGDGRFDQLVFEIEVNALQAGDYWVYGALRGRVSETIAQVHLAQGPQIVALSFNGMDVYMSKVDGPYVLDYFSIADTDSPSIEDFFGDEPDSVAPAYRSLPYSYGDFGVAGASFTGDYGYQAVDSNGDGYADTLVVDAGLNVEKADAYTVQGILEDGEGQIWNAVWTGPGPKASLRFEGMQDKVGPFSMPNLHVRNSAGQVTDSIKEPYLLGDVGELSAKAITLPAEAVPAGDGSEIGAQFVIGDGYSESLVDADGDGQYDQLVISVDVEVEPGEGGQTYRIEGWLVDDNDTLISWAMSNPQVLSQGVHSLSLAFDGRIIHEHGVDGPYTLMALKALPGDRYEVLNEVHVAYVTQAYDHSEFEEPLNKTGAEDFFADNMEDGPGQWQSGSLWSLTSNTWFSYSHSWEGRATDSQSGSLRISLDISNQGNPALRFKTCYNMQSASDVGAVEVSTNGADWTPLVTYSDSESHWITEYLDLGTYGGAPQLQLRFNASAGSQEGLFWYVDDVRLTGWPDSDRDGLLDIEEDLNHNGNSNDDDTDGDGIPDYLEPNDEDSDGDGLFNNQDRDDDGDGVHTEYENPDPDGDQDISDAQDTDNDGVADYLDRDDDGDGVYTDYERPDRNRDGNPSDARDTDGFYTPGTPDYLDPDDDGDGTNTIVESADPDGNHNPDDALDTDGDGAPNYLDPSNGTSTDDDGDGVDTIDEDWNRNGNPTDDDGNGNNIPDYMDPTVSEFELIPVYMPLIFE